MSYILDALKKKETDNTDSVPDLKSQHYHSEFEDDSSFNWKLVAVLAGILISITLVYLAYSLGQKQSTKDMQNPVVSTPESQVVAAETEEKVLAQKTLEQEVPKQAVLEQKASESESAVPSQPKFQVETKPLEVKAPVVQKVEPKITQSKLTRQVETASTPQSQNTNDSNAQQENGFVEAAEQVTNPSTGDSTSNANHDLSALPAIRYTSHVYADNQKDRFVMLNGRSLGIGQRLPNGIKVVDILEDDLVISFQGKNYQIPSLTDIE